MAGAGRPFWHWSPRGDLVVGVTRDNQLKLYDVAKGTLRQRYVEKDHFSFQYTCAAWTSAVSWNDQSKKKVVPAPKGSLGLLALGTDKGTVSVWDLTRGVVAAKLGEGQHLRRVTGIAFSTDGTRVFTASGEPDVLEWDVKSGEVVRRLPGDKHGASAVCIHHETNVLAVGRTRVHLIDASDGSKIRKFSAGHASSIVAMAFSGDGRFLATASEGSRYVSLFDVKGKRKSAVASLALDGCPVSLDLRNDGEGTVEGSVVCTVLAILDTGAVRIVRQELLGGDNDDEGSASSLPSGTLRVVSAATSSENIGALGGRFVGPSDAFSCCLAYGNESDPLFETGNHATDAAVSALMPVMAVAGAASVVVSTKDEGSKKRKRPVDVVEASDVANKKLAVDAFDAGGDDAGESEEGDGGALQLTIAERLEAMNRALKEQEAEGSEGDDDQALVTRAATDARKPPKAGSLVTVLSQALKSSDDDLLEQCLLVHDNSVISTTVRLLPPPLTIPLIDTLVRKLERGPNRAPTICPWVKSVLTHHTSYLVTVPSLHQKLSGLHQLATRRVAVLPRLLGLAGRLDLVLSQISKQTSSSPGEREGKKRVTNVYVDHDDEEGEEGDEAEEAGASEVDEEGGMFLNGGMDQGMDEDDEDDDDGEEEGEEGQGEEGQEDDDDDAESDDEDS